MLDPFRVEKGEILGFLGPNGAGKTTTMRILTCFLPATPGTARVAGLRRLRAARSRSGGASATCRRTAALPRHGRRRVPDVLRPHQGVPGRARRRRGSATPVDVLASATCGTSSSASSPRATASASAWRQALLHDPTVLILDEPTVGLDPNQIIEIRELIKDLARRPHGPPLDPHPARGADHLRPRRDHQRGPGRRRGHARGCTSRRRLRGAASADGPRCAASAGTRCRGVSLARGSPAPPALGARAEGRGLRGARCRAGRDLRPEAGAGRRGAGGFGLMGRRRSG